MVNAPNRQFIGEHAFDVNGRCDQSGMDRKQFEDQGRPKCTGIPRERLPIPD
jgi:hypothetical protein